jgi:hypothetical protein
MKIMIFSNNVVADEWCAICGKEFCLDVGPQLVGDGTKYFCDSCAAQHATPATVEEWKQRRAAFESEFERNKPVDE